MTSAQASSPSAGGGAADLAGNLAELVSAAAARRPDHPALLFRDTSLSWAQLNGRVDAAAAGLQSLGLSSGDRVGVQLGNTPDFAVAYFGALRAGLVAVPLNTGYTHDELRYVLGDSGARALVTRRSGSATGEQLLGELDALEHLLVTDLGTAPAGALCWDEVLARGADAGAVQAVGSGEQLAVLLYTSGTSGRPKGAMLPHRALLANLDQGARIEPPVITADDVVLLVLPLFHVYGLNAGLGAVAYHGATGVLVERFDPVETLEEVRRQAVTSLLGAPPMYVAWSMLSDLEDALGSVRIAMSGAAPLPVSVQRRILDATGRHVFEGYGLTETAPVLTSTLLSEVPKPDSIGRALPGVELRLVDNDSEPVEEEDPGEILARGDNLFLGYWPDAADGPDEQGWWPTGDIAYADSDGDLHLVDRRREMILVSGFNVYPREVEEVLVASPEIAEAAVLGTPHPYTGESVKALVVLESGARLSAEDVIAHCARSLARFKCPTSVSFVGELPHSATGKVSKGRLRELES